MSFSLFLFLLFMISSASLVIGYQFGFRCGADAGFDEGYEFACDPEEVTWRLTATGNAALDAPREPLADLQLHRPDFPDVYWDKATRTFKKP